MNSNKSVLGVISLVLMLPALCFCIAGILIVACGLKDVNRWLDQMMTYPVLKLLVSPLVVLGGPLVAFALNAWKIFHLSADRVNEEFVIAFSVKPLLSHLLCLGLAGSLMLWLLTYAFVENFKIVAH